MPPLDKSTTALCVIASTQTLPLAFLLKKILLWRSLIHGLVLRQLIKSEPLSMTHIASFIGLVMEKTTALNDKETINFAGRVGPGIVFSRNQTAISVPNVVAKSIVNFSGNGLGVLTGAGFNFKISENQALELNIDKTWGKANNKSQGVTADVLSLGTGLRFAF